MVLGGSGWFWLVLDGSGWFWMVLAGSGWFRCLAQPIMEGLLLNWKEYTYIYTAISKKGNGTGNGMGNGTGSGNGKVIQYIKELSIALQSTSMDISFHQVASQ